MQAGRHAENPDMPDVRERLLQAALRLFTQKAMP